MHERLTEHGLVGTVAQLEDAWNATETRPSAAGHTPFEEKIRRVVEAIGLDLSWEATLAFAEETCERSADYLNVDPDALILSESLKGKAHTPLVTNYDHPPEIHRFLMTSGLDRWLDPVIISGELGIWKPDPRIIQAALDAIEVEPGEALYVGDSRVDVEAALATGVTPVLIARQDGRADPFRAKEDDPEVEFADLIRQQRVHVIRRLTEVEDLL
jgi:HAD superfamily hydrolase (TIGR01549 family)